MRVLEDALVKNSMHNITVRSRTHVALYILNQKRAHIHEIEKRFGVTVMVVADDTLTGAVYHAIERGASAIERIDRRHLESLALLPCDEAEGAAADGRIEAGVLKRGGIDRVLRQDRHQAEDQRQREPGGQQRAGRNAGDDVVVDDHVTFSDIKSGRHIVVGTSSGKGLVLGGTLTQATSGNVVISVGTAAQLAFTTQPSATGTSNTALTTQPVVTAQDAGGNTVTTSSDSITLAIGTNGGPGGTLSGTVTLAATNGVATFSGLSINKAGTGYTLTAASTGLTGATSSAFNVTASNAATIALNAGDNQSATVGTAVGTVPSVIVAGEVTVIDVGDTTDTFVPDSSPNFTVDVDTNPVPVPTLLDVNMRMSRSIEDPRSSTLRSDNPAVFSMMTSLPINCVPTVGPPTVTTSLPA